MKNITPEVKTGGRGYAEKRDFTAGPPTYTDDRFLNKIALAARLDQFAGSALVADLASGPGKLGHDLQELFPRHRFVFIDISPQQIQKAQAANPNPDNQFLVADIRRIPQLPTGSIDIAIARYTLKDLTQQEKIPTLIEIRRILKPNGIMAIADMVSPNRAVRSWLNRQHGMKQEFEWRNPKTEGCCYIPTTQEWLNFLHWAGFNAEVFDTHTSFVTTSQWVTSGQTDEEQKNALDKFILGAPTKAKEAFNIRIEKDKETQEEKTAIDYPLVIITARKK